ncbi:MAG: hypothetical protein AAF688_12755 [Bacteroidota bacterium]
MKTNITKILFSVLLVVAFGCKDEPKKTDTTASEEEVTENTESVAEITIEKLENSPAYETASLELQAPNTDETLTSGEAKFDFDIQNYELGAQTNSDNANLLANSGKGQHIHFILNNQPYSAHYEASFSKELPDGTHHLVAFLSRSYHESVKNDNSVVVKKVQVGQEETQELDMEAPTLIYSRPKGTYAGKDTENLLLDFFVLNTTLSEDGNKVRATINDEEFIISEWAPQVLKGLPKGEISVKLELIDAEGNLIEGPFNSVTRTVTLKE